MWVGFLDRNDPFNTESDALLQQLHASGAPIYGPEFAVLEIGCAVARRLRDAAAGRAVANLLRSHPHLNLVETRRLLPAAEDMGCERLLRGADALYAATARLTGTSLVTWDRELVERGGALTPRDWLLRRP